MRRLLLTFLTFLTFLLFSGCGKNDKPPPPSSGVPNAKPESGPRPANDTTAPAESPHNEAQRLFATVCATCHAADGTGTGPVAESLNPKPRNYTDSEWQKSVTDDEIKKIIVEGGQAVGKSPTMPANPRLRDRPEIVNELVAIVRGFARK